MYNFTISELAEYTERMTAPYQGILFLLICFMLVYTICEVFHHKIDNSNLKFTNEDDEN